MESTLIERNPYGYNTGLTPHMEGRSRWASTCYRIQMLLATTFLMGGLTCIGVGLPSLIQDLSTVHLKVTGGLDLIHLRFNEDITFDMDTSDVKKSAILSVVGIFSVLLSTGMLFGMALQR